MTCPSSSNASARLSFLGPEPDRWRDTRELYKALSEVNGPDHFIDMDKPEDFQALPNDRYQYADWLRTNGKEPKDIGFLPYSMLEGYQKVQVLFSNVARPEASSRTRSIGRTSVILRRLAWALCRRRIATAARDHPLQRLEHQLESELVHPRAAPLAVRRRIPEGSGQDG